MSKVNGPSGELGQIVLGPAAFSILRAEDEPWLESCFVPPPEFGRMAGPRSVIIFGEPGSGKTAIYRALQTRNRDINGKPLRLLVPWRPIPPSEEARPGLAWVKQLARRILDACAASLIHHLARYPEDYTNAPLWAQARLIWFIHRFTLGKAELRWGPLTESQHRGAPLIREILATPAPNILYEDASLEQVIAELVSALQPMGMKDIWVLTDGLEGWSEVAFERLVEGLRAFFSTLSLFGHKGLVYKLCLPAHIEPAISQAGGLARRRIESIHLRWDTFALRRLVERRLAFAFGQESFPLEQLCTAPGLLEWLEKVGGESPREWLDQVAVLAEHYAAHPDAGPIDEATWKQLRLSHPPRFYLDDKKCQVIVGGRRINLEELPEKAYEILRYLYQRSGEVVSKSELYFRIYRGLDRVPRPADPDYEPPKRYLGLIDTNLWRLRKAIEPDPKNPILLITRRGLGVTLQVRW